MSPRPEAAPGGDAVADGRPIDVTVIDAGVGNLANLARALERAGGGVTVSDEPAAVAAGRCLVLPGVGAFAPPRRTLAETGLEEALAAALDAGAWLLGVCVGYQLLFEVGEEHGTTAGLGLLPGRVTALPATVPLPHIGWSPLVDLADHPLVAPLARASERPEGRDEAKQAEGAHVYFVHGFAPEGVPDDLVLARAVHGRRFAAVAGRGRVLGTQFHPEKSGPAGLALLGAYLELARGTAVDEPARPAPREAAPVPIPEPTDRGGP